MFELYFYGGFFETLELYGISILGAVTIFTRIFCMLTGCDVGKEFNLISLNFFFISSVVMKSIRKHEEYSFEFFDEWLGLIERFINLVALLPKMITGSSVMQTVRDDSQLLFGLGSVKIFQGSRGRDIKGDSSDLENRSSVANVLIPFQ